MSCVGAHAAILEVYEGLVCNVHPFNSSYQPMTNIKTVNAAFAYDTDDGNTYVIYLNQALDFSDTMHHSLLCPNQARMNGVIIDECPKFLDPTGRSSHSVYFPKADVTLPLLSKFPISFLPIRRPTEEELNTCEVLELTNSDPWQPDTVIDDVDDYHYVNSVSMIEPIDHFVQAIRKSCYISAITHVNKKEFGPSDLAKRWNISLPVATRTLETTTQDYIRNISGKLARRVKTKAHQNRYRQMGGYLSQFCSDIFQSKIPSLRGNKYITLFCNRGNYVRSYPMKLKSHAHHSLDRFLHEVGIPSELLTDGANELIHSEWGKTCMRHKIRQNLTEPYSPWQNPAELAGGLVKRRVQRLMKDKATPVVLWDYCWEYVSAVRSLTAVDNVHLDNRTGFEKVHGYSPDISEYLSFDWYDWVWYHDPTDPDRQQIGRWLGPAHDVGQGLAYYILTSKGRVKTRSSVSALSDEERASHDTQRLLDEFTSSMESIIGNFSQATQNKLPEPLNEDDPYSSIFDDSNDSALDDMDIELQESRPDLDFLDNDAPIVEASDKLIGCKVQLPHADGEALEATIKSRKRNFDGTLVGTEHDNPFLDTRVYEVEFADGSYTEYSANTILENLHQQIDDEGYSHSIMKSIIGHQRDENLAISIADGKYISNGISKQRITTKGWKLEVEWVDGTSSWVPLSILKESNPLETAEYAISRGIDKEPAFAWWVPYTIKKRNRIIQHVSGLHRAVRKKIKYGVTVPADIDEAYQLDSDNKNDLWRKAVEKELKNVIVAFKLLHDGELPPVGSKEIPYHLVFDVKFDLTRKVRLVAGGHRHKEVPSYATYSSVVSRESVRIVFMLAALNDLKVQAADIGNAYLNAPNKERVHVRCGPELFGPEAKDKIAIVVRALYGLKSAGNAWRHYFSNYVRTELGYQPTLADPDVYIKPEVDQNGMEYYSYFVVYVDDVLCCHHTPDVIMKQLSSTFRLKDGVGEPTTYLGTDIKTWNYTDENGTECNCWRMGSQNYVKEAIRVCEKLMSTHNLSYISTRNHGRKTPFSNHAYRPELDSTNFCGHELHTVFQNLIGVLRWICELGRLDIVHETAILSQYLAQPRMGHLQQTLEIFNYLKFHDRSWLVGDPSRFDITWTPRKDTDIPPQERATAMKELYPDACDEVPYNAPKPRGKEVDINVFVDADHAGNQVTRRSHTGIILMVNMAPVLWYSKRQNTVETSTFGSEFVALRIAVELIDALRYKLRMFGVPLSGPARVFCDNESVVKSSGVPESRLKKKHCSIAYHRVRESIAAGKVLIYYEKSESNLADLLTKPLAAHKREPLITALLS